MLRGLVATQVNLVQQNFRCQHTLEFQSDMTGPQQQADVVMELMAFGMSFKNAILKPVTEGKNIPSASNSIPVSATFSLEFYKC